MKSKSNLYVYHENIKFQLMKYNDSSIEFSLEQKIIHHLMLNASFLRDLGLYHGKMGIVILFFHYSRHTDNPVYEDFAGDQLDNIWEGMHKELPVSFDSGLTGIGWGIEYLIQNGFVEGNSNEICEELDHKIMNLDPRRMSADFLEKELLGLLNYILIRMQGTIKQQSVLPFDRMYINDFFQMLSLMERKMFSQELNSLVNQFVDFMNVKQSIDIQFDLHSFIELIPVKEQRLLSYPLGLKNGLAGYLYKGLMCIQ